ncbi:MAG: ATP-dependent RecD-like DNA helicase [Cyanobacteria bacterium J06642_2]
MSRSPGPPSSDPPLDHLQGVVERLTYHSEDSGYTIARLKVPRERELVTVAGTFATIQAGQTLSLNGNWREHPKYGLQFQVNSYRESKPATLTGIEKYLGSGLIKGVGPVTAKRIVAYFGFETLDVIEGEIHRLCEVPGIAQKRVRKIETAWAAQKAIKEVMLFLQDHNVSTTYAVKIFKQYGDEAIATVTTNPYQLTQDVYGIGFVTADAIARNVGIAPDSEYRYRSGTLHVLNEASERGHCFLPQAELIEQVVTRLALPDHTPNPERVATLVEQMCQSGELIRDGVPGSDPLLACYNPPFYQAETHLAERLQTLLAWPVEVDLDRVNAWVDRYTARTGMHLSPHQREAVDMAASHRIGILTGGPGCGKTFTTRTIVALWKAMGKDIALASPTGRAAQRLQEMSGLPAQTIHRLLEFDPKTMKFKRDESNPIPADAIVVDEASMLDLFLANALLKAVAPETQLLWVGDIDQLPSVGPGNVLRDAIASERIPVVRLTEVFRQARSSQIVSNAHRINRGDYPRFEPASMTPNSDAMWLEIAEPERGVEAIRRAISNLMPHLGFDPATDVQVLCPMARGALGTRNLNQVLQALINPARDDKAEWVRGNVTFRVGDRVIQKVNDYDREVFNGDLGRIDAIDGEEQELTVDFSGRRVTYDAADLNEIALAWAVTIHKSQGSEYPVAIVPVFLQHYVMLSRNLLYTALTRAKRLALVIGSRKAIGMAVRQVKDRQRYTLLSDRLRPSVLE